MGQALEKGVPVSGLRLLPCGFKNLNVCQYLQLKGYSVKLCFVL